MKTVSILVAGKASLAEAVEEATTQYHEKTSQVVREARMLGSRNVAVSTSQSAGQSDSGYYVHILGTILWS